MRLRMLLLSLWMVLIGVGIHSLVSLRWQSNLLLLVIDIGRLVLYPRCSSCKHAISIEDDLVSVHGDLSDVRWLCWRLVLLLVVLLLQLIDSHQRLLLLLHRLLSELIHQRLLLLMLGLLLRRLDRSSDLRLRGCLLLLLLCTTAIAVD